MQQLPLDFTASISARHRRAAAVRAEDTAAPRLFTDPPNLDVHLLSPTEAVATVTGGDPDRVLVWLEGLVGSCRALKTRRWAFEVSGLAKLAWVRPPAQVTLDAAATAVVRAVWAQRLGWRPLRVTRDGQRLVASSPRWPAGMRVVDAPWTAIAALTRLSVPLDADPSARTLLASRLAGSGQPVATASLAGTAVLLETSQPQLLESLRLPALGYAGGQGSGRYRMPLLAAQCLLDTPGITVSPDLAAAITQACAPVRPLTRIDGFPWQLYPFQARDVATAVRILRTTGGVMFAAGMGLGKTTQALAVAAHLGTWPLLVVAPLSAFSSWARQLGEMGVDYYLATEAPALAWDRIESGGHQAVVITYDRLPAFVELVERVGFAAVIADELQRIRTPGSKRSRALRHLAAAVPYRIGLSGTPIANRVDDVLPQAAFLTPGEWPPRATCRELSDLYPGPDPVDVLTEHLHTLMVRRTVEDTGARLPGRSDRRLFVQLTPEQRRALEDLEAEARAAREDGDLAGPHARFHAFQRLHAMRQIVNTPHKAGVGGPNPKVAAAVDLAEDMVAAGRKGIVFCTDRAAYTELGQRLDAAGIGWVGIWGSTPPAERIANEARFHTDPGVQVVVCTVAAGGESWTGSPTATWVTFVGLPYTPAALDQAACRAYRLNSDPDGPVIEITYVVAQAPGGSLDDRVWEILQAKRELFARVVDRREHVDEVDTVTSLDDLMYLLTGSRDPGRAAAEADAAASVAREQAAKLHARSTAHARSGRNRSAVETFRDDGTQAVTQGEWLLDRDRLDELDEQFDGLGGGPVAG